jgi:hypothetical protein
MVRGSRNIQIVESTYGSIAISMMFSKENPERETVLVTCKKERYHQLKFQNPHKSATQAQTSGSDNPYAVQCSRAVSKAIELTA